MLPRGDIPRAVARAAHGGDVALAAHAVDLPVGVRVGVGVMVEVGVRVGVRVEVRVRVRTCAATATRAARILGRPRRCAAGVSSPRRQVGAR
eukprot:scaffold62675_cov45-Phaeocystis_antarctica.AAC.1